MTRSNFPVKLTLKNGDGEEIGRGTIWMHNGRYVFRGLEPGEYQAFGIFADGSKGKTAKVRFDRPGNFKVYIIDADIQGQPASSGPPIRVIASSAVSISVLSSFGGIQPFIQAVTNQLTGATRARVVSQSSSRAATSETFSTGLEAKLKQCIRNNLESFVKDDLIGIPTFSDFLESFEWDQEPSSEFESEFIYWYSRLGQLQATIEDCDPSLVQEILAAQNETFSIKGEEVIVTGALVNIREGASAETAILGQVSEGTILRVDRDTVETLSDNQKIAIDQRKGWQPVLLSKDRRGYIYSLYLRPQS